MRKILAVSIFASVMMLSMSASIFGMFIWVNYNLLLNGKSS